MGHYWNINKVYEGGVQAVKNVNLTIEDKEFVVLVGPSGCGKSTTLRMIAGLEDISSGDLSIDGERVNDKAPKDRDIAMVFQNYALYPHMTVRENMAFGLEIRKFDKATIDERVMEAANILDIKELLDRRPRALSGGQRQRVAVGRAIVRHPKVFLFDEPLSNLDAKLRVQMRAEISALHNRLQSTMVYVTHDQVEAMTMGDKIVVMRGGVVQQIGKPLTLYNKPVNKFVAGFIGSPPMNFLQVRIEEQAGFIYAVEEGFRLRLSADIASSLKPYCGKDVSMGVRAEDLVYVPKADDDSSFITLVKVIETLGSHTEVYARTKRHDLVARVGPQVDFSVGEECRLAPIQDKLVFFDNETEQTIGL